jgi:ADP-ribose pyrophosphatase
VSIPPTPIPEVKSSEIAFHGFFDVRIDQLHLPHGPKMPYYVVDIGVHAVAILAMTQEGKFVITKEYRHPTRKWMLGCCGGRIDTGESPIEAARRELLEETGYGNGTFSLISSVHPLPALTDHQINYIFAENVEYVKPPALEPFELIHIELKTKEELFAHIASGKDFIDGVLCTAFFLHQMMNKG